MRDNQNYALILDLSRISVSRIRDLGQFATAHEFPAAVHIHTDGILQIKSTWDNTLLQNSEWICYETPYNEL